MLFELAYKDHLGMRTTFFWSVGWSLYIQVSLYRDLIRYTRVLVTVDGVTAVLPRKS